MSEGVYVREGGGWRLVMRVSVCRGGRRGGGLQ